MKRLLIGLMVGAMTSIALAERREVYFSVMGERPIHTTAEVSEKRYLSCVWIEIVTDWGTYLVHPSNVVFVSRKTGRMGN